MNVSTFLAELRSNDIHLTADGDRLRCNAPTGALTPDLQDQLRQRKSEILEFLRTAEAIAKQQQAIVPLQPRGTRIPVFATGGHNGDVFAYRDLVRHVGDDQPFFGLHPPGLDGSSRQLTRVEDLAAYFAAQIQAFRPNGPYIIAGYCAGGAVALEIAQQLLQRGAAISFLALFGCAYPAWYRFSFRYWWERVVMHTQVLATLPSLTERRQYLNDRIRARLKAMRDQRSPAATDPVSIARFKFEQTTIAAVRRYRPKRFAGRVCLFVPSREWLRLSRDAPASWRAVAPNIEEYWGPETCIHERMLMEPDAPVFAELFRQCRDNSSMDVVPLARRQGAELGWL